MYNINQYGNLLTHIILMTFSQMKSNPSTSINSSTFLQNLPKHLGEAIIIFWKYSNLKKYANIRHQQNIPNPQGHTLNLMNTAKMMTRLSS